MSEILRLDHITVAYGVIKALKDISLFVNEGEIVTLIGANGAGKSTTLRTISGLLKPQEGKIYFKGKDISGKKPHIIVQQGISQAPEGEFRHPACTGADAVQQVDLQINDALGAGHGGGRTPHPYDAAVSCSPCETLGQRRHPPALHAATNRRYDWSSG